MLKKNSVPRFCVVGAGPCGLTSAKNLLQSGFSVDVWEREADLGGNWHFGQSSSSVFASTHLISSRKLTEFVDFPMSPACPHYPGHRDILAYLRDYATHFQLLPCLRFNSSIERATPSNLGWEVQIAGESQPRSYDGLVIANGHHNQPAWPKFTGQFAGQVIHAQQYKTPDILQGKRVLIVGAGNSGCDIAAEAAQHAERAVLSMRRGYHFFPKFVRGVPIDIRGERLHRWGLPLWLRRTIAAWTIRWTMGRPEDYGLPAPDHALFETHPIVNSQLPYYVAHGRVTIKPNVGELTSTGVRFVDGSEEPFDLIIYATGYEIVIPFVDHDLLFTPDGEPRLYLNAFHPNYDNLLVAGLIQPDSGIWGLADLQARLFARFQQGLREESTAARKFQQDKSRGHTSASGGLQYVNSPRHRLEVEYFSYRGQLLKHLAQFGDHVPLPAV